MPLWPRPEVRESLLLQVGSDGPTIQLSGIANDIASFRYICGIRFARRLSNGLSLGKR